ncbi:hypothetical protein VDG1235_3197 [Verrucomicrobiia bacterium DG1235]|nr:hypothetical protein VDG1235_3197 [Verrucomicrobiae bacterium DG1235]
MLPGLRPNWRMPTLKSFENDMENGVLGFWKVELEMCAWGVSLARRGAMDTTELDFY